MSDSETPHPEKLISITEASQASGLTRGEIRYLGRLGGVPIQTVGDGIRSHLRIPESCVPSLCEARDLFNRGYHPKQVVKALVGVNLIDSSEVNAVNAIKFLLNQNPGKEDPATTPEQARQAALSASSINEHQRQAV